MIFIISEKDFKKNKKKLVIPKDYIFVDAMEDDEGTMSAFTNVITMDALNPPAKLVKLASKEEGDIDDFIDYEKLEKLEKNYFKSLRTKQSVMALVSGMVNRDINIFVVMRNKAHKYYAKRLAKLITNMFDVDFKFVAVFKGSYTNMKKVMKIELDKFQLAELDSELSKNEKKMEKSQRKKKK